MAFPNVMATGRSGMMAAKANIATTGHNITNATTEGYSRERTENVANASGGSVGKNFIGDGVTARRTTRINDEYLEKQIQNAGRDVAHMEEKDLVLRQTEDIFNEMGGEGLNRLMSKFFNEFRKLANEPDSEAVRQSVREATQSVVNDFKRIRSQVAEVTNHIDARIEGYSKQVNDIASTIRDLNVRIQRMSIDHTGPSDLLDQRDLAVKRLAELVDISVHKENEDLISVDIKGIGPLVVGPNVEKMKVMRSKAQDGAPENSLQITMSGSASPSLTQAIKGGKIGGLLEVRDQTLSTIMGKLDDLAYGLTTTVNEIHRQGVTRDGVQGVNFFKPIQGGRERASAFIDLSDEVRTNVNYIATGAEPDSPGDNRIAIALSGLQGMKLMNGGNATMDDYFNSIVTDVGVFSARNRENMNQTKDIVNQLGKVREQISGVSIDEETANLLQFHQVYDASAKVIQVADDMLKTVLELKR